MGEQCGGVQKPAKDRGGGADSSSRMIPEGEALGSPGVSRASVRTFRLT